MQQLCLKIKSLNINEKDNGNFVVKFIDPKTPKQFIKVTKYIHFTTTK